MKFSSTDLMSTNIEDRRGETGWRGAAKNAGRFARQVTGLEKMPARPIQKGESPVHLPTEEDIKKLPSAQEQYANEDFYGFGETEESAAHAEALKKAFDPASLGSGQLRTLP